MPGLSCRERICSLGCVSTLDPKAIELRRRLADALPDLPPRPSARTSDPLEVQCRLYLERLRWPGGVACPRCDETERLLWLESLDKWHCYGCRYQFSVTARTLFHQSHLALWKWFAAVQLMVHADRPVAALELWRLLGGSYKSFWFMAHRIRVALSGEEPDAFRSVLERLLESGHVSYRSVIAPRAVAHAA
jgi:transposase-like protein